MQTPRVDLVTQAQHESLVDLLCELHTCCQEGCSVDLDMGRVATDVFDHAVCPLH